MITCISFVSTASVMLSKPLVLVWKMYFTPAAFNCSTIKEPAEPSTMRG